MVRVRSREELLDQADTYLIQRYIDGRIDHIDALKNRKLLNRTTAEYQLIASTNSNVLKKVEGLLFPEIWNNSQLQNISETITNIINMLTETEIYVGDGTADRIISLAFQPSRVLISSTNPAHINASIYAIGIIIGDPTLEFQKFTNQYYGSLAVDVTKKGITGKEVNVGHVYTAWGNYAANKLGEPYQLIAWQ